MIYSKVLVNRFLIVLILCTLMLLSTILVSRSLQTEELSSVSYIPQDKVERVSVIIKEWSMSKASLDNKMIVQDKSAINSKALINFIDQFSCNQRVKNIIYTSSIKTLKKYPSITKERFVESMRRYFYPFTQSKCIKIIQDLDVINRINHRVTGQELDTREIVKTFLTENLGWHSKGICIYHKLLSEDLVYLDGPPKKCIIERDNIYLAYNFPGLDSLLDNAMRLRKTIRIKNVNKNTFKKVGYEDFDYVLTLDPKIQKSLNVLEQCFEGSELCKSEKFSLDRLEGISVVLIDPLTSGILGIKCLGSFCSENGMARFGDLATLTVRSPPASISKIFFGLGIASEGKIDSFELTNQLKTSGSKENLSGKRNEWWEKAAICDDSIKNKTCMTLVHTNYFANMFGFSTSCKNNLVFGTTEKFRQAFDLTCGRVSVIEDGYEVDSYISPFLGYLPIQDDLYLNERGIAEFLSWDQYNKYRDDSSAFIVGNDRRIRNTSQIIQTSIGGGNARVSALGVASTIANLSQIKNNIYPKLPFLLKKNNNQPEIHKNRNFIPEEDSNAAQMVLNGLEKALLPETADWKGVGTASSAFTRTFDRICGYNCPVKGKTGTVSFQDKNHKGKTLFGGLTDIKQLADLIDRNVKIQGYESVAIGVIASEKGASDVTNRAADMHMKLLKYIFFD